MGGKSSVAQCEDQNNIEEATSTTVIYHQHTSEETASHKDIDTRLRHMVRFNKTVEVINFTRVLGGCGVPSDGAITMCLGREIGRSLEPLHDVKEMERETLAVGDGYMTPQARAIVLKRDMGEKAYFRLYKQHRRDMVRLRKQRRETANDQADTRCLCSSVEEAIEQGVADALEAEELFIESLYNEQGTKRPRSPSPSDELMLNQMVFDDDTHTIHSAKKRSV
eukprot:GEMP01032378.1.p1 GENE.GEMP01032378.1~~GEMP01032378.1.p1  ORF type:complete len:223 (+),score=58.72 GEMP01032378.1:257-925(+)